MKAESELEKDLRGTIEGAGGKCIKLPSLLYRGIPDRLVLLPHGLVIFIELKKSTTARTKASVAVHQSRWEKILRTLGMNYVKMRGPEDLKEFQTRYIDKRTPQ